MNIFFTNYNNYFGLAPQPAGVVTFAGGQNVGDTAIGIGVRDLDIKAKTYIN